MRLPALPEHASSSALSVPESLSAARASDGRRVLVVDDHADGAASLEALLCLLGHEVPQARDGLEAIEVARTFEPDVIFTDIGVPRLNGLEAARRIRELPLAPPSSRSPAGASRPIASARGRQESTSIW